MTVDMKRVNIEQPQDAMVSDLVLGRSTHISNYG